MRNFRKAGWVFFFLLLVHAAYGQVPELIKKPAFRNDAQAAVDSIYNFNDRAAEKKLQPWRKKYPADPLWQLMQGVEDWWTILSDLDDLSQDQRLYKTMKKADYEASKLLYNHPDHADALIVRMVANGYIARQHSNRDEWMASLSAARKAYSAYEHLEKVLPNFPDLKLADGLKLYYSKYLPQAYPVVKTFSWFLPKGNKKKGLEELHQAARHAIFARGEALYFLGNINYNYEHHYGKAARFFTQLYQNYPNNNYYTRLLVRSLFKMGHYRKAMSVINDALTHWQRKDASYKKVVNEELQYWKGRILLHQHKEKDALPLFEKSFRLSEKLPRSRHRDYYPAAAYYAGTILADQHNNREASKYFKKVLDAKTGDAFKKLAQQKLNKDNR